MVRYADDIVVGFEHQADAERFWEDMRARLAEFALTLHPGKTRLIEFGRHAAKNRRARGLGKPETFNFLGFTHISGHSRRGGFQLKRKSRSDRVRARLQAVKETCVDGCMRRSMSRERGCDGSLWASTPITLSRPMRWRFRTSVTTSLTSGGGHFVGAARKAR